MAALPLLLRRVVIKKRLAAAVGERRWMSRWSVSEKKEILSEDEIEDRKYTSIMHKMYAEYNAMEVDCPEKFREMMHSEDFEDLKNVYKEMKKFNRKNGVVPQPKQRRFIFSKPFGFICDSRRFPPLDEPDIMETGVAAVQEYNNYNYNKNKLEFISVLEASLGRHSGHYNLVIQARDLAASRVSIKLKASCFVPYRQVHQVELYHPAPFMNVLHKDDERSSSKKTNTSGDFQALLFANLHNCPIIDQRLGLKRQELYGAFPRQSSVKLSLDDNTLMTLTQFTMNQRPNLQLVGAVGACLEKIKNDEYMYHIIFVALEGGGVERKLYAAVSANGVFGDPKLVDLVAADSPRATTMY